MELMTLRSTLPEANEQAPYFPKYLALVAAGDIVATLTAQAAETRALIASLTEAQGNYAYADGKWTVKQVIGHVIDQERVFAYRILRIARGTTTPLEGFDHDASAAASPAPSMTMAALAEEYAAVRAATISLLAPLSAEAWLRRGIANQHELSVRALAWITAGHEVHHRTIVRERYLA